jgi:hypothetical protein
VVIGFARSGIAAGMIVRDDDRGRGGDNGRTKDFARVDENGVHGPD